MEFLETGEKIKKVRKELKMKQRELEDLNMTRALISMIEIGKRKPNKENMQIIVDKFKRKAEQLKLTFNLEASYFLRSAKEEAEIYCRQIIAGSTDVNEIAAAIEIANKYKLFTVVAEAYLKSGDISFDSLDYLEAQIAYLNALENYRKININHKLPYLYNMLGRCCINQAQNGQAFSYFKFAYENSILYGEEEIKKKSIYNMALCNNKLGNIDEVLKYVEKYIAVCDMEKDFLVYSYCLILKASCYDYKEEFSKAIEVLNNLLDHFNDRTHITVGNIYNNLGVLYCKQGDFKKSRECFNISEDIRRNKDMKNLSHTFMEKSVLYTKQQRYEDSINLIKTAIELAERYNDTEYILKGHQELIKIYKLLNRQKEVKISYTQILKLFTNKGAENYKNEAVRNSVELLRILLSEKDMENAINILDVLENIYGISEKNGI